MGARIVPHAAEVLVGRSTDSEIRQTHVCIQTQLFIVLVMWSLANHPSSLSLSIPTWEGDNDT